MFPLSILYTVDRRKTTIVCGRGQPKIVISTSQVTLLLGFVIEIYSAWCLGDFMGFLCIVEIPTSTVLSCKDFDLLHHRTVSCFRNQGTPAHGWIASCMTTQDSSAVGRRSSSVSRLTRQYVPVTYHEVSLITAFPQNQTSHKQQEQVSVP